MLLCTLLLALCPLLLIAQAPDTLWTKTYGGANTDEGYEIQQTFDGGYIIVGRTFSFGSGDADIYLLKTNSVGDTLWTKTYGGNDTDYGWSVQQTTDGGYIITGNIKSFGAGDYDVYIIKTDGVGDTTWTKTYGGSAADGGYSIQQTVDGGYIIAGWTHSFGAGGGDVYLIKTDTYGDTIWTRTYGDTLIEYGYSVVQTFDNGYIILGSTKSFGTGEYDLYLIKTDSLGDSIWTKTYGGIEQERGRSVHQNPDSTYVVVGNTNSFGPANNNIWLLKLNVLGDTLWTQIHGDALNNSGECVQRTIDSGYIIVGLKGPSANFDVYLIRTDAFGDTLWTNKYGGVEHDMGFSIQQSADGGYIIAGQTTSFGAGMQDVYLIKTEPDPIGVREQQHFWNRINHCYTTIFNGPLILPEGKNYKVFDITGRVVLPDKIKPGVYFIEIDGEIKQKVVKIR